jgi:predicted phosphodiesterase
MSELRIAVISDIHGNADALNSALEKLKKLSIDTTVFLGYLLTYGCQPLMVLDILKAYKKSNNCIFIKGNHDQFYFDLADGKDSFGYEIPEFVSESILWTANELKGIQLQSMFNWQESLMLNSIYFAHANPYSYGNWQYIESPEQYFLAAKKLATMGCDVGIFGHSHRQYAINVSEELTYSHIRSDKVLLNQGNSYLFNAGSIGQPRGKGLNYMTLTINDHQLVFKNYGLEINLKSSVDQINKTNMCMPTKIKLISYFESSND